MRTLAAVTLTTVLAAFGSPLSLAMQMSQEPLLMEGTWEFQMAAVDENWDGSKTPVVGKFTVYLHHDPLIDPASDPTTPNLWTDPGDDQFEGFIRGRTVAMYKSNDAHCGGENENRGHEVITGTVLANGRVFIGDGIGFDSNPACGGTWTYTVIARKISDAVPEP